MGDLSYILAHLATSQINFPQLANRLNLGGLQGFLPSVQQISFFVRNGLRNERSAVEILMGAVYSLVRRGCRPQAGSEAPGYRALRKATACRALASLFIRLTALLISFECVLCAFSLSALNSWLTTITAEVT